jgi:hypothetical protein
MARRSLILDAGAIIALARNDAHVRSYLIVALERGVDVLVPPIIVTQTIRGAAQDALINRLLNSKGVTVPPVGEELARAAGRLLAASGLRDAADAQVVAEAAHSAPATVLTSDPDDLRRLSAGLRGVDIVAV